MKRWPTLELSPMQKHYPRLHHDSVWDSRPTFAPLGPEVMKHGPRLLTNAAEAQAKLARAEAKRARKAAKRRKP